MDLEKTTTRPIKPRLKLLCYNIQVGMSTGKFSQYVTGSWRHVLPHGERMQNLNKIARLASHFDIVALQEVDGGSFRSGFINQVEYLAQTAHFPHWYCQCNRRLGKIAQHANGVLSHYEPIDVADHKLPGFIPGRGAIAMTFGQSPDPLLLIVAHLALSARARNKQLAYIANLVKKYRYVIVMGDLNCTAEGLHPLQETHLDLQYRAIKTFPSWAPKHHLDHVLVSSSLTVTRIEALEHHYSDHLPVAIEVALPENLMT